MNNPLIASTLLLLFRARLARAAYFVLMLVLLFTAGGPLQPALAQSPAAPNWPPRPDPVLASPAERQTAQSTAAVPHCPLNYYGATSPNPYIRIVLMSYQDVKWEIYIRDGCMYGVGTRLTNNATFDGYPRIDAAMQRIVFVSDRAGSDDLYSMDLAGQDVRRLTDDPGVDTYPAWSPDGQSIAFISDRAGDPDLYLIERGGANPVRLLALPGLDADPIWSPDGRMLAWVHWISDTQGQLYTLAIENGQPAGAPLPVGGTQTRPSRPAWSGDGKLLAFSADINNNGWVDLAWIDLATQVVRSAACPNNYGGQCDVRLGGFMPGSTQGYASIITYATNGMTRYIKAASLIGLVLNNPDRALFQDGFNTSTLDFSPDAANSDMAAPVSWMKPLPEFTQADALTITIAGQDSGAAGLYTLSYAISSGTPGSPGSSSTDYVYSDGPAAAEKTLGPLSYMTPGQTLYFYSIADDWAGHTEPPHAQPDTFTKLYSWSVEAQVTDQRGQPLQDAEAQITPGAGLPSVMNTPRSVASGALKAYFAADGTYTAQITRPGFSAPPALAWSSVRGKTLSPLVVLTGAQELLQNGQFDDPADPLTGWQAVGSSPAGGPARTGTSGAMLAPGCAGACLTAPEPLPMMEISTHDAARTPDGLTHLIFKGGYSPDIAYTVRSQDGSWSPVQILATNAEMVSSLYVAVDGRLAFFSRPKDTSTLNLHTRAPQGSWQVHSVPFFEYGWQKASFDDHGRLHLLYRSHSGLYLHTWDPTTGWSQALLIDEGHVTGETALAAAPDGTLHILFKTGSAATDLLYQRVLPGGVLPRPQLLTNYLVLPYGTASNMRLMVDSGGVLHGVFSTSDSQVYYFNRTGGQWSTPVEVLTPFRNSPYTTYAVQAAGLDPSGNVQVMYTETQNNVSSLFQLVRRAGEARFENFHMFTEDPSRYISVKLDTRGYLHYFGIAKWGSAPDYRQPLTAAAQTASLSQVVTIPAQMNKPTLSLLYQMEQPVPAGQTRFVVEQTPTSGSPVALTLTPGVRDAAGWQHAWADLSAWAGQTVTLTLRIEQAEGEAPARLILDEVSLSAYESPVITSITLDAQLPLLDWWSRPIQVTVYGENFAEGVQARLDDRLVTATWRSERELVFTLPADLPPGVYQWAIENPGGARAIAPASLRLGWVFCLPALWR